MILGKTLTSVDRGTTGSVRQAKVLGGLAMIDVSDLLWLAVYSQLTNTML